MNEIKQDYEQAIEFIKQGQLKEAQQLLVKHNHPKTNELFKKVELLTRANSKQKNRNKRQNNSKPKSFQKPLTILIGTLFILGILTLSTLYLSSGSIDFWSSEPDVILPTIPANVTPRNPQNAFAAIAPETRSCLESNCGNVTIYQSDQLLILGVAEGDLVEGSIGWYFVESNNNRFFIHENSITFRGATPIVPTVDWRQEVQPVYYGNDNTSQNNSSSSSQSQYTCSGNQYDCSSFRSCSDMRNYFNSCPGDPSRLDGDNDGIPCEDMC